MYTSLNYDHTKENFPLVAPELSTAAIGPILYMKFA